MRKILTLFIVMHQVIAFAQFDSIKMYNPKGPDYSKTRFPTKDGLTYNQFVGETIAGYTLANGWRKDTLNGGFNKEIYDNPYVSATQLEKKQGDDMISFRYKDGKLYSGAIADTLTVSFTPSKIAGYFSGKPYYESKDLKVIFRAQCVNGLLQGKGVLSGIVPQYGIYNNLPLSACNFENGEMVGICKCWDLNSIQFEIKNQKIKCLEAEFDYFELTKLLELTEITYVKGSSEWTQQTVKKRNGKVETIYPMEKLKQKK